MSRDTPARGRVFAASLLVAASGLASAGLNFLAQVLVAATLGAGPQVDAFLVASGISQFVSLLLVGSLGVVLVPVLVGSALRGGGHDAQRVAHTLFNATFIATAATAVVGMMSAQTLIRLAAPGLAEISAELGGELLVLLWPTVVTSSLVAVLTGLCHARRSFVGPAVAAVAGPAVTLLLAIVLVPRAGVLGFALATVAGSLANLVLLLPVLGSSYRLRLELRHPDVAAAFALVGPPIASGVLIKSTPLIERFFASELPLGAISHLGYAYRLVSVLALLCSIGLPTIIYPRMANAVAIGDLAELRRTASFGLRLTWVVVAPMIAIAVTAGPALVTLAFRRGAFSDADAQAVSGIMQIYVLAQVAVTLGNVTSRALYALKLTTTMAIIGAIEACAYFLYAGLLARALGVAGLAGAFVIYNSVSLVWQMALLWAKSGKTGGSSTLISLLRSCAAAVLAALPVAMLSRAVSMQASMLIGIPTLLVLYVVALRVLKSPEERVLRGMVVDLTWTLWGRARSFLSGRVSTRPS